MDAEQMQGRMDVFRRATEDFYSGRITAKEYKGLSGGFGSYAQRGGGSSMVRLRAAGGSFPPDKLRFVAECIERYGVSMVHFTTCQAMQLHNLSGEAAVEIVSQACANGIVTLGGGGDYPRNVTAPPLSGVERGEAFDVLPYARAAEEYVLGMLYDVKLPRKLKIGFSSTPENSAHATFRDLGYVARADGLFDVYSGGGLGANPRMGVKVVGGMDPSDLLHSVRAMVRMFVAHGDYSNRSRARVRYMQDSLGPEGYARTFAEEFDRSKGEGGLECRVRHSDLSKRGNGTVDDPRAVPQSQEGLYAVRYHPVGGDPEPRTVGELADFISEMDGGEARISPDGTVYLLNCDAGEARRALELTRGGAETLFESSVSCVGSTVCQIGLRDSHGLLVRLVEMSRRNGFADGVLPRVRISGCGSSCGAHQIGVIGFQGASLRRDGASVPAFKVFADGSHRQGEERFGGPVGTMAEEDVPRFLEEVGRAVAAAGMDFRTWFADRSAFDAIASKYVA